MFMMSTDLAGDFTPIIHSQASLSGKFSLVAKSRDTRGTILLGTTLLGSKQRLYLALGTNLPLTTLTTKL